MGRTGLRWPKNSATSVRSTRAQLALGHTQTARYFFFAAAAVYRVGQYGILEVTDERLRIYHKLDEAFSQFAALFESPMTKVAIPYKGYDMEGWLIEPQHCQKRALASTASSVICA